MEGVQLALKAVPDERSRPVVDLRPNSVDGRMDRASLVRLAAVELFRGTLCPQRRLTVDLTTCTRALVQHDGSPSRLDKRFGGAHAGGAGSNDDDRLVHASAPPVTGMTPVVTLMPGLTAVSQALTRRPSSSLIQQSWQAAIRQKPARYPSPNSKRRNAD